MTASLQTAEQLQYNIYNSPSAAAGLSILLWVCSTHIACQSCVAEYSQSFKSGVCLRNPFNLETITCQTLETVEEPIAIELVLIRVLSSGCHQLLSHYNVGIVHLGSAATQDFDLILFIPKECIEFLFQSKLDYAKLKLNVF